MATENQEQIIQYVPFFSFVHPSFWHTFTQHKLDIAKLEVSISQIYGRYTYRDDIKSVFEVDGTSFNSKPHMEPFYISIEGTILNKDTIEEYKNLNKALFLEDYATGWWFRTTKKYWIESPNLLLCFLILTFADLKKFNYYYWFTFPNPNKPIVYTREKPKNAKSVFKESEIAAITLGFAELPQDQKSFFLVTHEGSEISVVPLSRHINVKDTEVPFDLEKTYFSFADPSNGVNPGWPLRALISALLHHYPDIRNKTIKALGLRWCSATGTVENSMVYEIKIPKDAEDSEDSGWIGWERNEKGNFGPRLANMSASMDPVILANTSSDLNTKLIKWRLVPDLDLGIIKKTKCLLLGAGTLGCHVARNLLAWGFRDFTFLDSAKVSYSNPTRQVLFNYQDALNGGRYKAEAASENLKCILPTVRSRHIVSHIPMPGHPVGESLKEEVLANIETLVKAIKEHDVIFLLLDSREGRWLPTLLAALEQKIVINAALGFDSYLVMRHGLGLVEAPQGEPGGAALTHIPGAQLGCYFCNDVTAPGNSQTGRTLDQQCTVTRPGVASIAGALAVELLSALLQHPLKASAPALCNMSEDADKDPATTHGHLGLVPHSIRGFLPTYETITPTCPKFKQCIACSDTVLNAYKTDGINLVLQTLETATYLEIVTGLDKLHMSAELTDVICVSDEEVD